MSLVAVLVVSILAASFLELATSITRRIGSASDTSQALYLAEAGLAESYTGLAVARTGNVGSEEQPVAYGGGLFWVEATEHPGGLVEIESTAMYGTGRVKLGLVCEPVEISVSALGMFGDGAMKLFSDTLVDSFDSTQGSYGDQVGTALNQQTLVGSNADVAIGSDVKVRGDVTCGPDGEVSVGQGALVTGTTSARPEAGVLPPIEVPPIQVQGRIEHESPVPLIVPPGEVGYERLAVGEGAEVILKGPLTVVTGELALAPRAELVFDTLDGQVVLHVTERLDLDPDSLVTMSGEDPAASVVMFSGDEAAAGDGRRPFARPEPIALAATSQFYGFIYAPNAKFRVGDGFEIFGGLVCEEVELEANGKLHYDLALGPTLEALLPRLHAWRVIDIPQPIHKAQRLDPFTVLGLDPTQLASPAEAHEDQLLKLEYVNQNGTVVQYLGPESDFDWTQVQEVLYGTRDGVAFQVPAPDPPPPADPNLDLVSSSLNSQDLRDALIAAAPVSDRALIAASERVPSMDSSDLRNVLDKHCPMSDDVLAAVIASPALESNALENVLIDNSPLEVGLLQAVLDRIPPLSVSDLLNVLSAQ